MEIPPLPDYAIPPLPDYAKLDFKWTDEQLAALKHIEEWYEKDESRFIALTGPAGSGKSTVMREAMKRLEYVAATAMTGKAALRLRDVTGYDATTLHKILYYPPVPGPQPVFSTLRDPPFAGEEGVVIVDESSMMTPAVFDDLRRWGVRAILVGDSYQLPPVITGNELKNFGEDYSVFRQVGGPHLQTVMRSVGGVLKAATHTRTTGEICTESNLNDAGEGYDYRRERGAMEVAVNEWLADPKDHMLITWRNETRMAANHLIRERLGHGGPLPDEGEPVLIKKNGYGFMNGEIVPAGTFEDGPKIGSVRTLWMTVPGSFGGKRILVTVQGRRPDQFFDGGSPWVENLSHYHSDVRKLADRGIFEPVPITWGYCLTAHSAQGSEARRVTVFLEGGEERSRHFRKETTLPSGAKALFSSRWIYTATTRGKKRASLVVSR